MVMLVEILSIRCPAADLLSVTGFKHAKMRHRSSVDIVLIMKVAHHHFYLVWNRQCTQAAVENETMQHELQM